MTSSPNAELIFRTSSAASSASGASLTSPHRPCRVHEIARATAYGGRVRDSEKFGPAGQSNAQATMKINGVA